MGGGNRCDNNRGNRGLARRPAFASQHFRFAQEAVIGPLAGIRVIDLTSVLMGPYATQFLGDYGADVIKVEPPSGDVIRAAGPSRSPSMGPLFINANRSKRSVVLNLKEPEARDLLLDLCREADVLVYNVRPAAMKRLGLSWDEVRAVNPRLIYAGLYGYGQQGRYAARPAYDDLMQGASALSHLFMVSGSDQPRYAPNALADRVVGLVALSAILAAIVARSTSGFGQRVDVPMFETMVSFVLSDHLGGLTFDPPLDKGGYGRQLARDRRPMKTADSHVCVLVYTDEQWRRFLAAIGRSELLQTDRRFSTFAARNHNIEHVYTWLAQEFLTRTTAEWIDLLDGADVPVMTMHTLETVLADPHLADVGLFRAVDHPSEGRMLTVSNPVQMSETPIEIARYAPTLGEHTVEVLLSLGITDDRMSDLIARGIAGAADNNNRG